MNIFKNKEDFLGSLESQTTDGTLLVSASETD